jgi:hypothetical protein
MNNIISYSIIIILTLISIITLGNIDKIEKKIKLKGTKIVLFFIILMSYMTLISFPVKQILNNYITEIKLPKGNKGSRGNRGEGGSSAICETCGDDLCLKKILFNITNTYNYWRQLNGLKIYPDTYVIKNEYLKDKIVKHCKSEEFQKIIKKYGSNNKNCPENLKEYGCGAYDYMFKMWSIWILIILKYKNGMFFLESDSLTDVDFDGLIDKDDCFLQGDIVKYVDDGLDYIIDKSTDSKRIHPMYHIYEINTPSNKTIVHISQLVLTDSSTNPTHSWKQMFTDSNTDAGLKIKRIKRNISNKISVEFSANGVNEVFMKTNGLPDRGKLSPFDEIKKYDAWYWGRGEQLKPEIIITKPFISEFKKTCPSPLGRIKFLKTNKYYELFTSKNKKYNKSMTGNKITIDEILGDFGNGSNEDIVFLRASKFVDTNEHGYFKEYKPIGDIIIKETERLLQSDIENSSDCTPDLKNKLDGYTNVIGKKITKIDTYLVSGDTKSPVDFELKWHYKKTHGINKGYVGLSIWKPIAPVGYIAMGYVVDQRYFDGDGEPPKPNFDSIACVPTDLTSINTTRYDSSSTTNTNWTPINSDFFTRPSNNDAHYDAHHDDINKTINILRNNNTNTFSTSDDLTSDTDTDTLDRKINVESDFICTETNAPICEGDETTCDKNNCDWDDERKCSIKQEQPKNPRTSIKDKKFSILKLYE